MTHRRTYRPADLAPYIHWLYLDHAWGVPHSANDELERLHRDAERLLRELNDSTEVRAVVRLLSCHSDGDDIVLHNHLRLPLLRQQHPDTDGYCHCLADYICPDRSTPDTIGIFATTVHTPDTPADDYTTLLRQTLADRLAEAAAERLHEEVRRTLWGYAPDEQLTPEQLHACQYQGIRPAVGYPSLPDISLNFVLDRVLDFSSLGITLTCHAMMQPHASVSGLMFAHPAARYFTVGTISQEQLNDYARRRELPPDELRSYLAGNLKS